MTKQYEYLLFIEHQISNKSNSNMEKLPVKANNLRSSVSFGHFDKKQKQIQKQTTFTTSYDSTQKSKKYLSTGKKSKSTMELSPIQRISRNFNSSGPNNEKSSSTSSSTKKSFSRLASKMSLVRKGSFMLNLERPFVEIRWDCKKIIAAREKTIDQMKHHKDHFHWDKKYEEGKYLEKLIIIRGIKTIDQNFNTGPTHNEIKNIAKIFPELRVLYFNGANVKSSIGEEIGRMPNLKELVIPYFGYCVTTKNFSPKEFLQGLLKKHHYHNSCNKCKSGKIQEYRAIPEHQYCNDVQQFISFCVESNFTGDKETKSLFKRFCSEKLSKRCRTLNLSHTTQKMDDSILETIFERCGKSLEDLNLGNIKVTSMPFLKLVNSVLTDDNQYLSFRRIKINIQKPNSLVEPNVNTQGISHAIKISKKLDSEDFENQMSFEQLAEIGKFVNILKLWFNKKTLRKFPNLVKIELQHSDYSLIDEQYLEEIAEEFPRLEIILAEDRVFNLKRKN